MIVDWNTYPAFALTAIALWTAGAGLTFRRPRMGGWIFFAGVFTLALFITLFWLTIGHAPLRTMGDTRLWYAFFVATTAGILYLRWHYRFLLPFAAVLATVFALLNLLRPEIHTAPLMPALQSPWFVPHVSVYLLSYAVTAAALLVGITACFNHPERIAHTDRLVRIGSALMIGGMLMGTLWAEEAWGDYWTWDTKECWAAVTWLLMLGYLHLRHRYPNRLRMAVVLLAVAFLALQITWYGVNHMPAAKKSLHTYTLKQ